MLETPEERIKLLKAGISARDIEKLYIIYNEYKVVGGPILYESNRHKVFSDSTMDIFQICALEFQ